MIVEKMRQGFLEYLVIEKKESSAYDEKILCSHQVKLLLPCEIRCEEGKEFFYYDISGTHGLMDEMKHISFVDFCVELIRCMEELENYLLQLDHVMLTMESIYVVEGKPRLVYCIEQNENIKDQWIHFVEEAMEHMPYEKKEEVSKVYEFHTFLREKNPTLMQMRDFLRPPIKEVIVEDIPEEPMEPWVEEMFLESEQKENKRKQRIALGCLVPILVVFSYCLTKLLMQGWLYVNIRNCAIATLFLGTDIGYLCAMIWNQKRKKEDINLEDNVESGKTMLLSEETQLLSNASMPTLVHVDGRLPEVKLKSLPFIIGSKEEQVDFFLSQIGVSRQHLKIEKKQQEFWVYDLNSTNGTYVNNERVSLEGRCLKQGDVIRIGLEEFRFML